jgi:putative ABC transport system permease protein
MRRILRRLTLLCRIDAVERSMADEIRLHIELETESLIRSGVPPQEARAAALRAFGGIEQQKELARDARGTRAVEDLVRDLRYGARSLCRNRAFTATAVLTFALGIGIATAIFSVVYGVLLRPLPYRDAGRLVALWEVNVKRGETRNVVSLRNFEDWSARSQSFAAMAALVPAPVTVPGTEGPDRVMGAEVSPGYFTLLGVQPSLGRDLTTADVKAGGRVVVLSDAFWRSRLAGDPHVLGRALAIGGLPHEIVGVMPPDFEPPAFGWLGGQALWLPLVPTAQTYSWGRFLLVVARLRDGTTTDAARSEIETIAVHLARERPENQEWSANVVPLAEQLTGHVRTSLSYVLATVTLLLILAVTNVGTLVLAHIRRRLHEFGVRRAIGASDARLFRQILVELLLLASAGCALGVAAAFPALRVLMSFLPPDLPRQTSIRIDGSVLAVSAGVTLCAVVVFGVIAARRGRIAPSILLRDGAPERSSGKAGGRSLVVAEIAIGIVVAVLAGLMARSLIQLRAVDVGFDTDHVVMGRIALGAYETEDARRAFLDQFTSRLRRSGFPEVGIVTARPFSGIGPATTFDRADAPVRGATAVADARWADSGFFRALRIPLVEGELFGVDDGPGRPPRALISESMARLLWPGDRAVGRHFRADLFGGLEVTVAGVIRDLHLFDPRTPPRPLFYLSAHRFTGEMFDIIVRTDLPTPAAVGAIRRALGQLDSRIVLDRVETMAALAGSTVATEQFVALLLSSFALLGLVLASVGIYGALAGDVAARTREIGIRMALGAGSHHVLATVLSRALTMAAAGVAFGAAGAGAAARFMRPLLFGIDTSDALSFLVPAVVVVVLAVAVAMIPASRASRVSPAIALRGE